MGLRINTNQAALGALRNLGISDGAQSKSLERLSTGIRINVAADDPAGLVISTQLRAQYTSMNQALDNCQNASNLIGTAEAALAEVHDLLIKIRESAIYALNSGAANTEQIAAEQDSVDSAIQAIDRVAKTTRFGTKALLNGNADFRFNKTVESTQLQEITVRQVNFDRQPSVDFYIDVAANASQANVTMTAWAINGAAGISGYVRARITGIKGSEVIAFQDGMAISSAIGAINLVTGNTGVYASANGADLHLRSVGWGAGHSARIEVIDSVLASMNNGGAAVADLSDSGKDIVAFINGNRCAASGNYVSVTSTGIVADITFDPTACASAIGLSMGTGAVGAGKYRFQVYKSGLDFQMNTMGQPSDLITIGLQSMEAVFLGAPEFSMSYGGVLTSEDVDGMLDTLKNGNSNDMFTNAKNAVKIADRAISDVSDLRAYLGALQADVIDTNMRSLGVAYENLRSSESDIRDLNFAAETSEFTRAQILFQSGTAVLASANLIPQTILSLLQ